MPRARRTCAEKIDEEHYCPDLAEQGNRCIPHAQAYEQRRGSKEARGYGSAFQRARVKAAPGVKAGKAVCWRCGDPIAPDDEWDMGHRDDGSLAGPEHRRSCNNRAAGLKAHGLPWTRATAQNPLDSAAAAALRGDLSRPGAIGRRTASGPGERRTAKGAARRPPLAVRDAGESNPEM